ncbi:hypothetical protein GF376_03825 [Candidatus Peregrinibacteria bacterium]|nr:hypothetical protein [Candidatus Peregrinibacteria bacterium]
MKKYHWSVVLITLIGMLFASTASAEDCEGEVMRRAPAPGMQACNVVLNVHPESGSTVNVAMKSTGMNEFVASVEEGADYSLGLYCPTYERAEVSGPAVKLSEAAETCWSRRGNLVTFTASSGMADLKVCDNSEEGECATVHFLVNEKSAPVSKVVKVERKADDAKRTAEDTSQRVEEIESILHGPRRMTLSLGYTRSIDGDDFPRNGFVAGARYNAAFSQNFALTMGGDFEYTGRYFPIRNTENRIETGSHISANSMGLFASIGVLAQSSWDSDVQIAGEARGLIGDYVHTQGREVLSQTDELEVVVHPAGEQHTLTVGASASFQLVIKDVFFVAPGVRWRINATEFQNWAGGGGPGDGAGGRESDVDFFLQVGARLF